MATAPTIIDALVQFRNVVLEGVPGTGKTFAARTVADAWKTSTGRDLLGRAEGAYAITMHPSTSYEDFVEGLRYDEATKAFVRRDGFILRVVAEAAKEPDQDFLVLLDEINRANAPKVLGDLLLTLEPSKRASFDAASKEWVGGFAVTLPYSGRSFQMPDNVYVLATMNTSDQSIAPIDAALRRRFAFVRVEPMSATEIVAAVPAAVASVIQDSAEMLQRLNADVLLPMLGPDAELGHSYLLEIEEVAAPPQSAVVQQLSQHMTNSVSRVFWTEHWSANGGSANQFDLVASGVAGHSSATLFYPIDGQSAPARIDRRDTFDLDYGGDVFQGNVIRWRGGERENGVWRLELQGRTAGGSRFSAVTTQVDPSPGHATARAFEHRNIVWFKDNGTFRVVRLPRDAATLSQLKGIASWHDQGPSGRSFGEIDTAQLASVPSVADDEPYITWCYAILPQLIAVAEARDAQELFAPDERKAWLDSHGFTEPPALAEFDQFLGGLGLRLEISGSGLGRKLRVVAA